jgi:hypothetical protein
MTVITKTADDKKILSRVLELDIPAYRDAYSDRTAWLMACFSELAYLKFDITNLNDVKIKASFRKALNVVLEDTAKIGTLNKIVDKFVHDHQQEMDSLNSSLGVLNYKLEKVFDEDGTQAILVRDDAHKRLVLAFRGTEKEVIRDIQADIDAKLESMVGGGKSHRGFSKAYWAVGDEIQDTLDDPQFCEYRLYLTGHSLGGALANIAAKFIDHKGGISACYTFGAPRVGNKDWVEEIKPPVYRIVNSSDVVPMMPPEGNFLNATTYIFAFMPLVGHPMRKFFLRNLIGYFHSGDMRYLTRTKKPDFSDAKLLPHTSSVSRIWLWFKSKMIVMAVQDHSMSVYRRKLGAIAIYRNA